jgi:hypothetical protein
MDETPGLDEMAIDAGIEMLQRYALTLLAQPPSDEEAWQSSGDSTDDEAVFLLMLERLWNAASTQPERSQIKRDLLILASAIRAGHSREHHDELWAALTLESFVKERS